MNTEPVVQLHSRGPIGKLIGGRKSRLAAGFVFYKFLYIGMNQNIGTVLSFIAGMFLLWMCFGGLFENSSSNQNTVHVNCSDPGMARNSPVCNGTYEAQSQEQNAVEDAHFQNLGH